MVTQGPPRMGAMALPRGKSFTADQNTRVREAVREMLPRFDNNRTALARELGISQAGLSSFLNERTGAGPQLASAVAHQLGISLSELIEGKQHVERGDRPVFKNLAGWSEAEATARAR